MSERAKADWTDKERGEWDGEGREAFTSGQRQVMFLHEMVVWPRAQHVTRGISLPTNPLMIIIPESSVSSPSCAAQGANISKHRGTKKF